MYISVILPINLDRVLTYSTPPSLKSNLELGCRVSVPLGKNKVYTAIVVDILQEAPQLNIHYKDIIDIIDPKPIIPPNQMKIWRWISQYYLSPLGSVIKTFWGDNLNLKGIIEDGKVHYNHNRLVEQYSVVELKRRVDQPEELSSLQRSKRQYAAYLEIINLSENNSVVELGSLVELGYSSNIIKQLTKRGIVEISKQQRVAKLVANREKSDNSYNCNLVDIDNESISKDIFEELTRPQNNSTLFINHSTKPLERVVVELSSMFIETNKRLLILTTDIYSAETLFAATAKQFGVAVGLYDLSLSKRRREDALSRISNGDYRVVISTKIGVGLPYQSLDGIFVVEEHSRNHKSETGVRFSARDSAVVMGQIYGCGVVLESVSPSLESYYNTTINKYKLLTTTQNRLFDSNKINIINRYNIDKQNPEQRGESDSRYFSNYLIGVIENNIGNGVQTFIYKNRLGYSRYIVCNHCGYTPTCDHCNISLIYRKSTNTLLCPICQKSYLASSSCLRCGSNDVRFMGFGTENIEHKLQQYIPLAKSVRIDSDTTKKRGDIQEIKQSIENRDVDVIIGTGLMMGAIDCSGIEYSAIVDADTLLNATDFRADERFFQLCYKMFTISKELIIQTKKDRLPILGAIARRDYNQMYQSEIEARRSFEYPPFVRLVKIEVRHVDKLSVNTLTDALYDRLIKRIDQTKISISVPFVDRVRERYISNIIIKISPKDSMNNLKRDILESVVYFRESKYFRSYVISIDVDPL